MTTPAPDVGALIARAEKSAHYLTFPFAAPSADEIREAGTVLEEAAAAIDAAIRALGDE